MFTEQMSQGLSLAANAIQPASAAAGNYQTGAVDMSKFRRVMFLIEVGAMTTGTLDAKIQLSILNTGTWVDAAVAYPTLTGVAITQITATGQRATLEIRADQMQGYRYARCYVLIGTAAVPFSCSPIGGEAAPKPASQFDTGAGTVQRVVAAGP